MFSQYYITYKLNKTYKLISVQSSKVEIFLISRIFITPIKVGIECVIWCSDIAFGLSRICCVACYFLPKYT